MWPEMIPGRTDAICLRSGFNKKRAYWQFRDVLKLLFLLPFAARLNAIHGGSKATAQLLSRLAIRHRVAVFYNVINGQTVGTA